MSETPAETPTSAPPKDIPYEHAILLQAQIEYLQAIMKILPNSYSADNKLLIELLSSSASNVLNDMTCLNFIMKAIKK
jgi:hypothetical protein